jgi:hypothetical protein
LAKRYIATGRVHPERADINISQIAWEIPDEGRVIISCDSSQLTVITELSYIDGWISAYIAAEHFAYIIIGALGFSLGSGYSVELIQVTEEDGTPHVFGVRPTGDHEDDTLGFSPHGPIMNRAFRLANENIFFRLALRDYLRAIIDHIDCPTYCYRAIESIKSAFAFKSGKDDWVIMHDALGTDKNMIEKDVKFYADSVRHGNWINTPVTDKHIRWKMLKLTRDILNKYLDYELQ